MGRPVSVLELTAEEAAELNRRIRGGTTSTRDCLRARIVLLRSRGMKQADVAREVGTSTASVNKWSQRFEQQGFDGLVDRSGRGRKAAIAPEVVERVIGKAGSRAPGTRRRSTRTTAAEVGISASSVSRIWRGHGLKPHLRRTFKLSNDPQFEAKFWDVVGLYLDPPEKSIVLCCDEKTQIQALQRTQPGLPLGSGHIRTETHDYDRHGTLRLLQDSQSILCAELAPLRFGHDLRVRGRSCASGPGGLVATLLDPQGRKGNLFQCHRVSLCRHQSSSPPPYSNSKG